MNHFPTLSQIRRANPGRVKGQVFKSGYMLLIGDETLCADPETLVLYPVVPGYYGRYYNLDSVIVKIDRKGRQIRKIDRLAMEQLIVNAENALNQKIESGSISYKASFSWVVIRDRGTVSYYSHPNIIETPVSEFVTHAVKGGVFWNTDIYQLIDVLGQWVEKARQECIIWEK